MKEWTILVTGATGFLGRSLVNRLLTEGYGVTAIGYKSGISPFCSAVEYMRVDLTGVEGTMKALKPWRWSAVINLAGPVMPGEEAWQESYHLIKSHLSIALNLCMCIPNQWRGCFIHASSMTVYGMPQGQPVAENHPRLPLDSYGMAKALAEDILGSWRACCLSSCWLMRFPGLFGEDRRSGALYNFVRSACQGKPLEILASKPTPWDILHIADAVEAIVGALRSDSYDPGPINISYGDAVELETMAQLIVEMTQSKSEVKNLNNIRHPVFQMDISRARQLLNWPPCTLQQRLKQLCVEITSEISGRNVA